MDRSTGMERLEETIKITKRSKSSANILFSNDIIVYTSIRMKKDLTHYIFAIFLFRVFSIYLFC